MKQILKKKKKKEKKIKKINKKKMVDSNATMTKKT